MTDFIVNKKITYNINIESGVIDLPRRSLKNWVTKRLFYEIVCRRRWLSSTISASLVLDSTGFWVRISAGTPILLNITTGGDITGGFSPGAGFPSCHKLIYRVSEDNFRGSACVSEWMLISIKQRWEVGLS
jgi:hypothetical protein